MRAIIEKEFKSLFKSFKSIAVILFFLIVSFAASKFFSNNLELLQQNQGESVYASSIRALVMFFGFLFVLSLSHDVMNREVENQTIRFLVTKSSRNAIVIGKFLGIFLFWFVCVLSSFTVIALFAGQLFVFDFLKMICFLAYAIGVTMLLSLVVKKPSHTTFIGILLGIAIPVLGIWSIASKQFVLKIVKYVLPYYYIMKGSYYTFIPACFAALMLLIALAVFKRRDL
ncbi:ABC transporter permease [Anoxybacteroides tepidamans]|uniref:ABC transporter permease n=1 Tax=Anoxybacteroides tepidamans TaxID=265948 RepID=UPI000487D06C|nr:ABC transporter permease subunit [Anoxybacillus tepidamans]